ncbi:MAG: DUF4861 family protein [Tenuifilaceae bacterium]
MKRNLFIVIFCFAFFGCSSKNEIKITVKNSLNIKRVNETVEITISDISKYLGSVDSKTLVVFDEAGKEIPSQLIFMGEKTPQKIIFQVTVNEKGMSSYTIKEGKPKDYPKKAFGRFIPERYDDYAWENDKIAFRIYGLALIPKDGASNGIDVWMKRTDKLVIDRWYGDYLAGKISYHKDYGEGCDCFKVGRTLGAGGMAPFVNDSLWLGINFQSFQVLDNGPIRTSFKAFYPPFYVDDKRITETRTISLDAGSQLTAIVEEFDGIESSMLVASGIAKRKEGQTLIQNIEKGFVTYKLDNGENGITYLGVVLTSKVIDIKENKNHLLMSTSYSKGEKLMYFTGSGWNKWGFETDSDWNSYVDEFSNKIANPLIVEFNK